MINPYVEQLENIISAFVNNIYKEVPPTEEEFLEKATLLRNANAPIMPVSDDEFAEIISRLKQSLVIQMDIGYILTIVITGISHGYLQRELISTSFFGTDIRSIWKKLNIGIRELQQI